MSAPEITSHCVGAAAEVPPGEARAFAIGDAQVAVFRLRTGELRAMDAICPHSAGPLADGQIDAKKVICPLHNYAFSLADGTCLNGDYAVRTYPVREEDGQIVVGPGESAGIGR
jgi:nitrite reductase (NADH) small subunit